MPRYQILQSYMCTEVHEVEADSEEEAYKLSFEQNCHVKTYDGDYLPEIEISIIEE